MARPPGSFVFQIPEHFREPFPAFLIERKHDLLHLGMGLSGLIQSAETEDVLPLIQCGGNDVFCKGGDSQCGTGDLRGDTVLTLGKVLASPPNLPPA